MKPLWLTSTLLFASIGALAQDVRYNYAAQDDFSKYKTYRWVQVKGTDQPDQITDQQIKTAVDNQVTKKS